MVAGRALPLRPILHRSLSQQTLDAATVGITLTPSVSETYIHPTSDAATAVILITPARVEAISSVYFKFMDTFTRTIAGLLNNWGTPEWQAGGSSSWVMGNTVTSGVAVTAGWVRATAAFFAGQWPYEYVFSSANQAVSASNYGILVKEYYDQDPNGDDFIFYLSTRNPATYLPVGGSLGNAAVRLRFEQTSGLAFMQMFYEYTNALHTTHTIIPNGNEYLVGNNPGAGNKFNIRFEIFQNSCFAKYWKDGDPEPSSQISGDLSQLDTDPLSDFPIRLGWGSLPNWPTGSFPGFFVDSIYMYDPVVINYTVDDLNTPVVNVIPRLKLEKWVGTDHPSVTVNLTPSAVERGPFRDVSPVTLTLTPAAVDPATYVDAATALLTILPSTTEVVTTGDKSTVRVKIKPDANFAFAQTDAKTVTVTITPSTSEQITFLNYLLNGVAHNKWIGTLHIGDWTGSLQTIKYAGSTAKRKWNLTFRGRGDL